MSTGSNSANENQSGGIDGEGEKEPFMFSLETCERELTVALRDRAALVFWNHIVREFDWYRVEDNEGYHQTLKLLRQRYRGGTVEEVIEGDLLVFNGTELHTMLVKFEDCCGAYMLLNRKGDVYDSNYTPYYFTNKNNRDKAIEYIVMEKKSG